MRPFLCAASAALLLAAAACAAPSSAAAPEGRDCFRNHDVDNFSVIDNHTVRVFVSSRQAYDLRTAMGHANDLNYGMRMALRSHQSWICTGNGYDVEIMSLERPRRVWAVETITRVPEDVLNPPAQTPPPSGS